MKQSRKITQRNVEQIYKQLNRVLVSLDGQVLDAQRGEIRERLMNLLSIINNDDFKEGISKVNDEGYIDYEKIIRELFYRLTYGKRTDYYFNNIIDNHIFKSSILTNEQKDDNQNFQVLNVNGPDVFNEPEEFYNFWRPILGDITAFFGDRRSREKMTEKGQYYIHEFDKSFLNTLTTVRDASSDASLVFLITGQPHAAAATGTVVLAIDALFVVRNLIDGLRNGNNRQIADALNEGMFIVAGLTVSNIFANTISKKLSISTNEGTKYYPVVRGRWNTVLNNIRKDFGKSSKEAINHIIEQARRVYDDIQKE